MGIFAKGEVLKQIMTFPNKKSTNILKSNIMHPILYLREIAAFVLFQVDKNGFEEIVNKNQSKKKFLRKMFDKMNMLNKKGNMLIYEKIDILKTLKPFDELNFLQLFNIATESFEKPIKQNEKFQLELDNYQNINIVITGDFFDGKNNYIQGDIITPYLSANNTTLQLEALEPGLILKTPLYNLNSVIHENYDFAEKLISNSLKKIA